MREKTNGTYPRYVCWENVPGAFSSNKGADLKAVLEAIIGIVEPETEVPAPGKKGWPHADVYLGDGWSVAYRILNAEHWGVPQRRKRIYLVGDLNGESAGKILFKSEGLSGYSAESFRAWQRAARDPESDAGTAGVICLNDQGGERMGVSETVCGTLRAESHGHPPLVAAGFCTEHSAQSRTIGYKEETAPTLRAGNVPAAIALEHHPIDSRIRIEESGTVQTLTNRMGTGGNNVPLIMAPPVTLKIRCGKPGGGKGALWQEEKSATLSTANDQTLFAPVYHGSKNSKLTQFSDEPAVDTLLATAYKQPPVVSCEPQYIVRRLTPTECARLQGFPDWWCRGLQIADPSEEEIEFWSEVFETHRRVVTKAKRPKTRNQIVKWLRSPHPDSAEYRMYGNAIAIPCAWFVLAGIVYYEQYQNGDSGGFSPDNEQK